MGYQVGVTPLQMVAAVGSIANAGELIEPRVVRAMYRDGRRYAVRPKVLRRTVSRETADVMTTIMEQVVTRGTAKLAQIPGFTVAGKTGTASKLIGGRYSGSENNVSFVGFGTFKTANRKARMARNPQTGAAIKIPKRRVPRFSAGKSLKAAVK